jgi:2-polyprenyl-3-methyl-5-hydroxy-6-metoxy-1,4-benzoquinol methylase
VNSVDLLECSRRFHQVVKEAIQQNDFPMTATMTVEEQLHSRRHVRQWIEDMLCFLGFVSPGDAVLDFGSGSGFSAVSFAYGGCRVNAIDIDNYMSDVPTHERHAQEQLLLMRRLKSAFGNLEFQHYKGEIPFPDKTFQAIMAYGVLEHIPEELHASVMSELRRVLMPGGYLFISYLPRKLAFCEHLTKWLGRPHHDRLWGDREIRTFLKNHRFEICHFRRIAFAPQHPSLFANKYEWLFNALDSVARVTPLALFSHHLRIVARKLDA